MRNSFLNYIISILLLTGVLMTGCKEEEPIVAEVIPEANGVHSFIWNGLHDYYLWNEDVPNLSSAEFKDKNKLNAFLNKYSDPEDLFEDLLYRRNVVDKWSFIVDDSQEIDNWISGISETMGYDFMLARIGSSDNLFGFVRYVYKDSPAAKAGMKRGDIFLKVNDQQLTISNYSNLLFSNITYKLSFGTIVNRTVTPIERTVTMTAVEMQENPIHKDTIFTFNNQKIGYLVYNGFNSDFDLQLNDVFKTFKAASINQLILDLRYNGGGSVQSSIYLASMIYGTDPTKVFAVSKFNKNFESAIVQEEGREVLNDYFVSAIGVTEKSPGVPINTLNLRKVYFIVSDNTASASELLINGLKPYMDVKVVGDSTVGKYTGSFTLKDLDMNSKPKSKWAMQPIVVKYANSQGVSDYYKGLFPTIYAEEDIAHLMPFGDPNETLLKVILDDIGGNVVTAQTLKSAQIGLKKVADSHDFKPFGDEMYINPDKLNSLKKEVE